MVAKPRVVHRDGIRFQGLRYMDPTLAALRRQAGHDQIRPARPHADQGLLLDLLVLDADGSRARPWLTLVLDNHSRAVAG